MIGVAPGPLLFFVVGWFFALNIMGFAHRTHRFVSRRTPMIGAPVVFRIMGRIWIFVGAPSSCWICWVECSWLCRSGTGTTVGPGSLPVCGRTGGRSPGEPSGAARAPDPAGDLPQGCRGHRGLGEPGPVRKRLWEELREEVGAG